MARAMRIGGMAFSLVVLLTAPVSAADERAIEKAIDRGVAFLRQLQQPDGTWPRHEIGATALASLTLLECGVPTNDPAVQRAAAVLRQASVQLTHTYSLSLAIIFFDLLGDPADEPLIEAMTVRLLGGQTSAGGWSYECPGSPETETRRLTNLVQQRNELTARPDATRAGDEGMRRAREPSKEIQQQLGLLNRQLPREGPPGDNSNTQFATLALWVARRHGMPVDRAVARLDQRFRGSQNADGGWGYIPSLSRRGGMHSTPAMTCAGLLGLAVAYGAANEAVLRTDPKNKDAKAAAKTARDPARDPAVRAGLLTLGAALGQPGVRGSYLMTRPGGQYYFLWSLERVGMAYGLKTIGKKDWYAWGADLLVSDQAGDGSWQGQYSQGGCDTCFALLFLRRANLARDLSASLKGKVKDPGEVALKAGGVGGESLKAVDPQPVPDTSDTSSRDATVKGANSVPEKDKLAVPRTPQSKEPKPVLSPPKASSAPPPNDKPPSRPLAPDPATLDAGQLTTQLVEAPVERQPGWLEKYKEGKGGAYTQALADAIPQLTGATKLKAREALTERLMRMTTVTLRDKLQDEQAEIRRAAALASALKDDKKLIPDLIQLLADKEVLVSRAAHAALRDLTSEDLGPPADANRAERARAIVRWKEWWIKQK
jgi:hypothetical protein